MAKSPTLSIITVTYNDAAGLEKTCRSLFDVQQSGFDFEHVIIDSSTKQNLFIEQELPKTSWPLKYQKTDPYGIYPAMNEGLKAAQGKLVWFLNSGDTLRSPNALQKALLPFQKQAVDLSISGAMLCSKGKENYPKWPKKTLKSSLLGSNYICHQAVIYRKSVFETLGLFNEAYRFAADYEHLWRCWKDHKTAEFVSELLVNYDMSGSSQNYHKVLTEFWKVQAEYTPELPLTEQALCFLLWSTEYTRIGLFKEAQKLPIFGPTLKRLWRKFKSGT